MVLVHVNQPTGEIWITDVTQMPPILMLFTTPYVGVPVSSVNGTSTRTTNGQYFFGSSGSCAVMTHSKYHIYIWVYIFMFNKTHIFHD
jgi:hypothetical protein